MQGLSVQHLLSRKCDLHRLGILIVGRRLAREGYTLDSVAMEPQYDPQIVAERDGERIHVAVRTAVLPAMGELECTELRQELLGWASEHGAQCYIASIGVDAQDCTDNDEDTLPRHEMMFAPLERF